MQCRSCLCEIYICGAGSNVPWGSLLQEKPKSNTFMVFGQGPHLCPGSELAITETMFLIHHLITNYRLVLFLGESFLLPKQTCDKKM